MYCHTKNMSSWGDHDHDHQYSSFAIIVQRLRMNIDSIDETAGIGHWAS
jgi:hypothetical protein